MKSTEIHKIGNPKYSSEFSAEYLSRTILEVILLGMKHWPWYKMCSRNTRVYIVMKVFLIQL